MSTDSKSGETRPWGTYEVLSVFKEPCDGTDKDVIIKRIYVNPGKRLSLQSHTGRDESWFFVSGAGEVTVGDKQIKVKSEQSIFVPKETKHRISNVGSKTPLVLIEISTGYFDEDDIIRYEDDFGRAKKS